MSANPLLMEIDVRTDGEHGQHGEVAIIMTTEQAERLASILGGMTIVDTDTLIFTRILYCTIRRALT